MNVGFDICRNSSFAQQTPVIRTLCRKMLREACRLNAEIFKSSRREQHAFGERLTIFNKSFKSVIQQHHVNNSTIKPSASPLRVSRSSLVLYDCIISLAFANKPNSKIVKLEKRARKTSGVRREWRQASDRRRLQAARTAAAFRCHRRPSPSYATHRARVRSKKQNAFRKTRMRAHTAAAAARTMQRDEP